MAPPAKPFPKPDASPVSPRLSSARRREFGIGKRAAHRANSAHDPERDDGETARQIANLKSEAGENARADHVRDHDAGGGK